MGNGVHSGEKPMPGDAGLLMVLPLELALRVGRMRGAGGGNTVQSALTASRSKPVT
jgi:hypothetical protein